MLRLIIIFVLSVLTLSGCHSYSQQGELVYLNAQTSPELQVPADLAPTTLRQPMYPISEGEVQTSEQGPVDVFPPSSLGEVEQADPTL